MKHTKIFAFILAALLSAAALCACQSPSPDPADTTPAPPLSEVVETTPAVTTPATSDVNIESKSEYVGKISSPDNISLEGIKIDVYDVIGPKYASDPSPDTIAYIKYDTAYDFSDYEASYIYKFSVYTDAAGNFSLDVANPGTAIMFDFDTFPSQYGIRGNDINLREPNYVSPSASDSEVNEFVLEKVTTATIGCKKSYDGFHFVPELYSADKKLLYGKAALSRGRFDDGFVDAMINGTEIHYSATVKCGDLSVEAAAVLPLGYFYSVWEWRVDYLYYNNYIDKAQYDEIYRTTEPSNNHYY